MLPKQRVIKRNRSNEVVKKKKQIDRTLPIIISKATKAQSIASARSIQSAIDKLTLDNINFQYQIDESNQKLLSLI